MLTTLKRSLTHHGKIWYCRHFIQQCRAFKCNSLLDITKEEWDKVFAVDVYAPLYLTQLVAPVMKEKGKCVVINTCSVASYAAHFGFVGYISSKHAIAGLTKSMAFELGPEIRCNGIAPGAIPTAMVDSIGGVEALQMMVDGAPMKRVGQGEDIAALALFLASDESEFVDGQIIRCDADLSVKFFKVVGFLSSTPIFIF